MARMARFKVYGRYNGKTEATVEVDRNTNLISVRPKHFKKAYEMRLEDVAEVIMWRCIKADLAEKKKAKKVKRGL
jgi:hypothetical protein